MGLDQYAGWTDGTKDEDGDEVWNEFMYWRKSSHIQDWMQKLYASKTGNLDPYDFNCVKLKLTKGDIEAFIADVKAGKLQCVDGFFFGASYDCTDPDIVREDLRFAHDCLYHIDLGRDVYYNSWW